MPCYSPLKAYRAQGGRIVFSSKEGFADRPLELQCGQCVGCRIERSRQWALRCVHEASLHERNCFITLTYSPEFLPYNSGLDITHWQKFAKRLRKRIGPFRYFHCGEYGEVSLRPHYHALVFGCDFGFDRVLWKVDRGNPLYRSETLEKAWKKGFCSIGSLTFESAAYVSRYVMKKRTGPMAKEAYSRVDVDTGEVHQVKPEYISMSRRPGIGAGWFEKFSSDVYPADEVVHEGRRFRPPRFYDEKLEPDELAELKARRHVNAKARGKDLTPERLVVREKVLNSRLKLLKRII